MGLNLRAAGAAASLPLLLLTAAACSPGSSSASAPSASVSGGGGSATAPVTPAGTASPTVNGTGTGIKTASTGIGTVLASAEGLTIYWFAADSPGKSNCAGGCATYWPPVKGPVSAAAGVSLPGKFGTITRADGTTQATYDGHPLYTYSGDPGVGMTTGNGINASGGLWWAMTPGGAKPGASASKSGGSGY